MSYSTLSIKKRGFLILFIATALAIVGGAGYLGYRNSAAQAAQSIQAPPMATVTRGDVVLSVTAPGRVATTGTASLVATVAGRVNTIEVQPGAVVTQGQVLAQLGDRATFEASVATAQLQVLQAQVALDDLIANAPLAAAEAQQALVQAQIDLAAAQRQLQGLQNPDLTALQAQVLAAQTALTTARENAQITNVGDLAQALEQARLTLQMATDIYSDAQQAQNDCPACPAVYAPAAGQMVTVSEAQANLRHAIDAVYILETQLAQAQRADSAAVENGQTQLELAEARLAAAQGANSSSAALLLAQADVAVAQATVNEAQRGGYQGDTAACRPRD